jgi:GWxTD domain-containing protein
MVTRLRVVFFLAAAIAVASAAGVRAGKPEFAIKSDSVRRLSPPMQRKIAGLQYLLNPYQLRQFFSLPTDSLRQRWIQSFWDTADPTPATPENEMRIEHEIRVDVASRMFANKQWPGWDRRGEIFIRYGPPDYCGKVHAEVTARKVHPPGELWFYRRHLMVIQFEDFNLNGRYDYAIKPLGLARDTDPELIEFLLYDTEQALQSQIPTDLLSFYRDPEIVEEAITDWTPLHETLYGVQLEQVRQPRLRGTTEGMDEIANPDTKTMVPNNPS